MKTSSFARGVCFTIGGLMLGAVAGTTPASAQVTVTVRPPTVRAQVRPARPRVVVRTNAQQQVGVVTVGVNRPAPPPPVTVVVQPPQPPVTVVVRPPPPVTAVVQQPAPPPVVVGVIAVAPPAMRVEHEGPRPSAAHVWVAGYWQWGGNAYAWIPGRWDAPQQPGAIWVAPQWQRRGHGWFFVQGRWDRGRGGDGPRDDDGHRGGSDDDHRGEDRRHEGEGEHGRGHGGGRNH